MKTTTVDWVLECIDTRQKYFNYSKGQYVYYLLKTALKKGDISKKDLLGSSFGFLMNKPEIKRLTKNIGSGLITLDFLAFEEQEGKNFGVSLGRWGEHKSHRNASFYQTSCPGENLVLQLNFDVEHDVKYHKVFNVKEDGHNFTNTYHPISKKANTMAWSRLDIDFDTGEAFIEEVQNDWLREVLDVHLEFKAKKEKKEDHWITTYIKETSFENYAEYIKSYQKYWDEAILMAVLDFIVQEMGINKVYYHTYESGNYFKGLPEWSRPPKSLYTKLPKRFGFKETPEAPLFWQNNSYLAKKIRTFKGSFFCFDYGV